MKEKLLGGGGDEVSIIYVVSLHGSISLFIFVRGYEILNGIYFDGRERNICCNFVDRIGGGGGGQMC